MIRYSLHIMVEESARMMVLWSLFPFCTEFVEASASQRPFPDIADK